MSETLADLSIKVDTSDLTKAEGALKKTQEATKGAAGEQDKLINELRKTVAAMTDLEKQTSKVSGALKDVAGSFNPVKLGAAALAGVISALSLGAMKEMVNGVIEGAASLNNLSKQTGLTVEELSVMKSVANQSGTSMETVTGATLKFQKALASSAKDTTIQSKAFKELGINTSDTSKTTEEYMSMAATKLEGLKDGWQKNNIVMALFGKSGTEVNEFLSDYANKGDLAAKITTEQAEAAEHYERTMKKLNATANQYKQLISMALLPVMQSLADEFLKMVTSTGKLDGETKKLISNAVADWAFNIAKGLGAAIDVGIALWNVIKGLGIAIGTIAGGVVGLGDVLDDVLHGRFAEAQAKLVGNATAFKDGMKDAWASVSKDSSTFYDMVNRAEANYRANLGKTKEATKDTRRQAKNIGDAADTAGDKGKQSPYAELLLTEDKAINKLVQDYAELYGVKKQTYAAEMDLILASDKYKGKLTEQEQAILRSRAAFRDQMEELNGVTKAQKSADEAIAKAMQSSKDEIAINRIRLGIKKDLTKTTDDERVAVAKYNVAQAEEALATARATGAEKAKLIELQKELDIRKQLLNTSQQTAQDNKDAAPQTFADGWSNAFDQYKKDATDAAKNGGEAFSKTQAILETGITNFVEIGKLGFKEFAVGFLKMIEQILVKWAVLNALSYATGGGAVPLSSMFAAKQANGGAWAGGVQMFADGGVVSSPTAFGMAGGKTGLMGEAGPEAIMPLKRGADGKLGVAMSGGGSQNTVVHNNMSVSIGTVDSNERQAALIKSLSDMMKATAKKEMVEATRPGGMFARRAA